MNYIYDILLNFNENVIDFYDWNTGDNISHIRKIPIFKIPSNDLFEIQNNIVVFDNEFLKKIKNKTELFKDNRNIEYCFLLSDGANVLGINIRNQKLLKSKLLLDEEEDIIETVENIYERLIDYNVIKKLTIDLKTRKEIKQEKYIKKELRKLSIDTLKYLYYECFDIKEDDVSKINSDFLLLNDQNKIDKLLELFKLIEIKH